MVADKGNQWCTLYAQWISQWIDETKNENVARTYSRALKSLRDSDMAFIHPLELKKVKFFGEKICLKLESRLKEYCKDENVEIPQTPEGLRIRGKRPDGSSNILFISPSNEKRPGAPDQQTPTAKRQKQAQYVPKYRSGGYALIITLRKYASEDGMGRTDLTRLARSFSDNSFDAVTTANGYYTAWNSMKTLIKNDLVYKKASRTSTYHLTEKGKEIADKLLMITDPIQPPLTFANSDPAFSSDPVIAVLNESELNFRTPIIEREQVRNLTDNDLFKSKRWPTGSFRVKLLLDNREIGGQDNRSFFFDELRRLGIHAETAPLAIGDAQWIAEHRQTGRRAALDFILERKRLDDLISSIRDGRHREQKNRLHRSTISTVFYLVEEPSGLRDLRDEKAVRTVLSQTVTADKFHLIRTSSVDETAKFLASTTDMIRRFYRNQSLTVVSPDLLRFEDATKAARDSLDSSDYFAIDYDSIVTGLSKSKLLTIKDLFTKMLMTTRGITHDKASIIQKLFPTPVFLHEAYDNCLTEDAKKNMLFDATANFVSVKKFSKKLSESVYEVWGNSQKSQKEGK